MTGESPGSRNGATERLKKEAGGLLKALGERGLSAAHGKVQGTASRLADYVEGGGGPGVMAAVTGAKGLAEGKSPLRSMFGAGFAGVKEKVKGAFGKGSKGGGGRKMKVTNIVESIDVGAPVTLTYNLWTQWSDFPKFMKKVENVDQPEEQRTTWKAQVFWSHRTWESTTMEQVPDDKIIWRSKGAKGYVDGAVTFHELAPSLTRVLVVLEYHPQGMFEGTGNIWRAQGRRARLELKHFQRHLMTVVLLEPDDIEGWRGTIHDGEVVESHEDAVAREEAGQKDGEEEGREEEEVAPADQEDREEEGREEGEVASADQEDREEDEVRGEESSNSQARAASSRAGADGPRRDRRPARQRPAHSQAPASAGSGQRRRTGEARRGGSK